MIEPGVASGPKAMDALARVLVVELTSHIVLILM
jgi:hypothetical protein